MVQIDRLATHSRLRNYSTFEEAASRGRHSRNVVDLRCVRVCAFRSYGVDGRLVRIGCGVAA